MPDEKDGQPGESGEKPPPTNDIDQELRKLERDVRARIHEPSHLERLAAASQAKKRRDRRQGKITLTAVIVVLVVAAGGVVAWGRAHHERWLGYKSAAASASAPAHSAPQPSTLSPLARARISPPVTGPPADPFAGTPADGWANGAAGITIPAARAHGPYTAAQVRAAYATTRDLLIAGNLDWPTLRGGYPAAFAKLLPRQERTQFLGELNKRGISKNGDPLSTRGEVASFAPGTTRFVTTVIKVHGTVSAGETTNAAAGTRVLRITFNYLFTYAVEPPGSPVDWMRIVDHQAGYVDFAQWDDPGGPLEGWFDLTGGGVAGASCDTNDGYIHPAFPQGPPPSVQPSGAPVDPYSLATRGSATHGCGRTTGT